MLNQYHLTINLNCRLLWRQLASMMALYQSVFSVQLSLFRFLMSWLKIDFSVRISVSYRHVLSHDTAFSSRSTKNTTLRPKATLRHWYHSAFPNTGTYQYSYHFILSPPPKKSQLGHSCFKSNLAYTHNNTHSTQNKHSSISQHYKPLLAHHSAA